MLKAPGKKRAARGWPRGWCWQQPVGSVCLRPAMGLPWGAEQLPMRERHRTSAASCPHAPYGAERLHQGVRPTCVAPCSAGEGMEGMSGTWAVEWQIASGEGPRESGNPKSTCKR